MLSLDISKSIFQAVQVDYSQQYSIFPFPSRKEFDSNHLLELLTFSSIFLHAFFVISLRGVVKGKKKKYREKFYFHLDRNRSPIKNELSEKVRYPK